MRESSRRGDIPSNVADYVTRHLAVPTAGLRDTMPGWTTTETITVRRPR